MIGNLYDKLEQIDLFYCFKLVEKNGFQSLSELNANDYFRANFLNLDDFFIFLISEVFSLLEQNKELENIKNNREKFFEIIMTFLDIFQEHKFFIKILFFHKSKMTKILIKNQKEIYFLISKFIKKNIEISHDYKLFFYTMFFIITLLKTLWYWLDDDTKDKSDTMMYLDKILENGEKYKDINIKNFFDFIK